MESFFIAKGFRMVIQNCPKKENLLIEKKKIILHCSKCFR